MEKHLTKNRPSYTIKLIMLIAIMNGFVNSTNIRADESSCFDSDGNLIFGTDCEADVPPVPESPATETQPFSMELEAVDPEQFESREPEWEAVTAEFSVTGLNMDDCCLRAIRGTKIQADALCKAKGKRSWRLMSLPPEEVEEQPIDVIQTCYVFAQKKVDSEFLFSCQARALSKCAWQSDFEF